ncbi:Periplasmic aromatic aldehyde oxidoreductase,FAD binding subunit YagS [Crocosphaera watsonii WH 0402]|uniref:Periplasmic aromatic aldehyde oxidoreductase,FAD binding subunit YagS n=1 Tax=Crocosphaera watsonii WH 0402 TaxID=1284629 RepID=T2JR52_CROWT|nr:FAD binding domain-containing protein [Crocosphaera watsonii]CCQ67551.1 Periplasmic aromatic aldehyde oxidoreductase,FAD binding subunit YagS [Crocosphaera watsonii WH 0402]
MKNFTYVRANSIEEAVTTVTSDRLGTFIAGGTNLVDRLKVFLDEPSQLVDVSRLPMKQIEPTQEGGLKNWCAGYQYQLSQSS